MFFGYIWIFSKLLRAPLKDTEVSTEHQKSPKVSQQSIRTFFLPEGQTKTSAGGQIPMQELEVKPV